MKMLNWNLAVAFTQENDIEKVCTIVLDQYKQAIYGIDDFNMTLNEYLYTRLDEEGIYMKPTDFFETEAEAEEEGFYWVDEVDRWLKLDVSK